MAIAWRYTPPKVNAIPVVRAAAEAAVEAAAQVILDESQQLVPVDTGALKASGQVTKEDGPTAAISYGQHDGAGRDARDTADYAIYVHERMDTHHEHGRAKFLEQAMHSKAKDAAEIMAETMRAAVDR